MAGKHRRQFGRLERVRSGRWRAAYTGPDGVLYRASMTFDAKDDAAAWLSARRAEVTMGLWSPETVARSKVQVVTFGEFAEAWLRDRPLKPRTRAHYRNLLDARILPTFGDKRLDAITAEAVNMWHATCAVGKPTTRAHAYGLLRTILGSAVQAQLIAFNVAHIRGAGRAPQTHRTEPATLGELETLVTSMPQRYRVMVLLAAWCALRFGELTELRRRDIDVRRGVVRVRRGAVRVDGEVLVGTPKSEAGQRDVAIPPHLLPLVEQHLSDHVGRGKEALVFPAASGGHMAPSALYRVFYPAREAAGRPDLRFHDLRHTGAVLAAQTGATLAELMNRLGHSTPGAAMRYQHAAAGRDAQIAAALSALVATPPRSD